MWRFGLLMALASCGNGSPHVPGDASPGGHSDAPVDALADAPPDAAPSMTGLPATGMCRDGWCWVLPLPQGNGIDGIWGAAANDVWAIAHYDTLMHYDGVAWTQVSAGGSTWGSGGAHLWGTSSTDIWATTGMFDVLHWNGTNWSTALTVGDPYTLGGTGPHDVLVYDYKNKVIQAWDGATWSTRQPPATGWIPIAFGGDASGTVVVSAAGGIAKWLGTAWGIADGGTHAANAALVLDATHVVLAQTNAVSFWDGATWTSHNPPVNGQWSSITGRSTSDIWIADANTNGAGLRYHWDGAGWTAAPAAADEVGGTQALWEDPTGIVWEGSSSSDVRRYTNASWSSLTQPANIAFAYGTADDDIMTISSKNVASHWNGTTWTTSTVPAGYVMTDIWASGPTDYWIAAGKSDGVVADRVLLHWDGVTWTPIGNLGTENDSDGLGPHIGFVAVWGSSATDIYAVGVTASYHFDGASWTNLQLGGGTDVFGSSATDVTIVSGTTLHRWDGTSWTTKSSPTSMNSGWENSPTGIWLTGYSGGEFFDGTFFVSNSSYAWQPAGSTHDMYTFGFTQMEHWTGDGTSTPVGTHGFFFPHGAFRGSAGHVFAVSQAGLLVH